MAEASRVAAAKEEARVAREEALQRQLLEAQAAFEREATARREAQDEARAEAVAAQKAGEAAAEAAAAAQRALAAAAELAAQRESAAAAEAEALAASAPPPPSVTARAGDPVPTPLPFGALKPLGVAGRRGTPAPPVDSLTGLAAGRRRLVLLFGSADCTSLPETLSYFDRELGFRDQSIDTALVAIATGAAPAVFTAGLRTLAADLSYPVYTDARSEVLLALGFAGSRTGAAAVLAPGSLALVILGDVADGRAADGRAPAVEPKMLGAFGASGANAAANALRSAIEILISDSIDAPSAKVEDPLVDIALPAATFSPDASLAEQWQDLLSTIDSAQGGARRAERWQQRPGGRGAAGGRGLRGSGGRGVPGRGAPLVRGRGGGGWPAEQLGGRGSNGMGAQFARPYGVWLPGLRRLAHLLNGTAGVSHVASSKVHRKLPAERRTGGGAGSDGAGSDSVSSDGSFDQAATPTGVERGPQGQAADGDNDGAGPTDGGMEAAADPGQLRIRIDGTGLYGAHKLVASYRDGSGLRTQLLYVSCDKQFGLGQLREVLRALQPVLSFILDDGLGYDSVPF